MTVKINIHSSNLLDVYLFPNYEQRISFQPSKFSSTIGNTLLKTNSNYYAFPDKTECDITIKHPNHHAIKDIQNYIYHFSKNFHHLYFRKYPKIPLLLSPVWIKYKILPQRGHYLENISMISGKFQESLLPFNILSKPPGPPFSWPNNTMSSKHISNISRCS